MEQRDIKVMKQSRKKSPTLSVVKKGHPRDDKNRKNGDYVEEELKCERIEQ